jgi:hypothetical protein
MVASILACIGFLAGGALAGVGGILGLVASGMLVCCGPIAKGQGKGQHTAAFVMFLLAAILSAIGLILALTAYLDLATRADAFCAYSMDSSCQSTFMGLVALLIWPSLVLAGLAVIMDIWATVKTFGAMKQIGTEMSTAPSA